MTSLEFRSKCETIVQDLTEKRQKSQTGVLKWLLTHMLFILTRCTRVLHFEKDSETIDEKSFVKFKECLKRVPSFEMNWVINTESADSDSDYALQLTSDAKEDLEEKDQTDSLPHENCRGTDVPYNESKNVINNRMVTERTSSQASQNDVVSDRIWQFHKVDEDILGNSVKNSGSLHEQSQTTDGSNLVICRICEELIPSPQLESDSYICAYADKCDLNCSDLDERLLRHAEVLEEIIDSLDMAVNVTYDIPENSLAQTNNSIASEVYSPKVSERRSKGVEGMFEDIPEMDTACIEDAHFANLRGHPGLKINHYGPPSSAGSVASTSSANTPRSGSFDYSWIEHKNPSEVEDVQQVCRGFCILEQSGGIKLSEKLLDYFTLDE